MLMPNRLKRASFARLAVGLAVLAFPLLATSVAQASIAGAIPSTTTIHPDIRSATVDPFAGPTGVRVCFDKTLNTTLVANGFLLGGYRAGSAHRGGDCRRSIRPTRLRDSDIPNFGIPGWGRGHLQLHGRHRASGHRSRECWRRSQPDRLGRPDGFGQPLRHQRHHNGAESRRRACRRTARTSSRTR